MQKKREFKQLTLDDRINIQMKYRDGWSFEKIANYPEEWVNIKPTLRMKKH